MLTLGYLIHAKGDDVVVRHGKARLRLGVRRQAQRDAALGGLPPFNPVISSVLFQLESGVTATALQDASRITSWIATFHGHNLCQC
jgi:hypothetical protein